MGLFDRVLKSVQVSPKASHDKVTSPEQDAARLLEEGMALEQQGQLEEALQRYEAAIELMPEMARAHFNRGTLLLDRGDAQSAIHAFTLALKYKPDSAAAHYNMGNAQLRLGHPDAGVVAYQQAITLKPDFVDAHVALGAALDDLGKHEDAVASYRHALELKPDYSQVHHNLASTLQTLGRLDEAAASYRRALELKPDWVEAHGNLGNVLKDLGQFDDAIASYRQVLAIEPSDAKAYNNLGATLSTLGFPEEALENYRRALSIQPDFAVAKSNQLFVSNYLVDQSTPLLLVEARFYGDLVARQARPPLPYQNVPDTARSLRVGLMSGDLCQHPVGNFLEGVLLMLNAHASSRLEFFAYPSAICNDEVSARIKECCRGWHSALGLPDERLAQQIRDDGIDILIDLSGHTAHNRLPVFAWKPAPVQVTWLGYLATTGVAAIDYLIADDWTLPQTEEVNFTEKIWRLPESYLCFTPPDVKMDMSPLPALSKGYVTFGSFNNLSKMNDSTVALWARVLAGVPGSRLLLKSAQLVEATVQQSVIARFGAHGVDANRLILKALVPRNEYLIPYLEVDIALDPFPYPGITTSVESLWMGVPVLTLAGKSFLSRQGVGLLMNAGLPEWIAADPYDYVARAIRHANDLQGLAALRAGLRQQVLASPIFNAQRFATHFETALRGMWQKWCHDNANAQSRIEKASNGTA